VSDLQLFLDFQSVTGSEWLLFTAMLVGLFSFVGVAETLRKTTSLTGNTTRKIVHILVGIFVFIVPLVFVSPVPGILMSALFIGINYFSVRFRLFKGMDDTMRETYGTVYFPLSFLILILLFWNSYPVIISTSILILGLADAAAAFIGQGVEEPRLYKLSSEQKSVQGSFAMFTVAFLVSMFCLLLYPYSLPDDAIVVGSSILFIFTLSIIVAVVTTVVEAMAVRGLDNLFIPLSAAFILYVAFETASTVESKLIAGFIFAVLISALSFRVGFLSSSGAAATFLMAVIIFGIGGWQWTIPMITFFILSSVISNMKNKRKETVQDVFEKSHKRDMGQVFANGGIASIFVVLEFLWPDPVWFIAYLGAIAAATADTWGTEFGVSFSSGARDIVTFRKVKRGTSGGISLTGIGAGIVGGIIIALSGLAAYNGDLDVMTSSFLFVLLIAIAGIIGSLFDSYLGALLQAMYKCPVCDTMTERKQHCNVSTQNIRGYTWMTNDYVNFACTSMGSIAAIGMYLFYV